MNGWKDRIPRVKKYISSETDKNKLFICRIY